MVEKWFPSLPNQLVSCIWLFRRDHWAKKPLVTRLPPCWSLLKCHISRSIALGYCFYIHVHSAFSFYEPFICWALWGVIDQDLRIMELALETLHLLLYYYYNHLLTTGTDDLTLWLSPKRQVFVNFSVNVKVTNVNLSVKQRSHTSTYCSIFFVQVVNLTQQIKNLNYHLIC